MHTVTLHTHVDEDDNDKSGHNKVGALQLRHAILFSMWQSATLTIYNVQNIVNIT